MTIRFTPLLDSDSGVTLLQVEVRDQSSLVAATSFGTRLVNQPLGKVSAVNSCVAVQPRSPGVPPYFRDRADAGRRLAAVLSDYSDRPDVLILALPRGGVPVAFEVARALHAPLDVFLVRKLGFPGHEEFAMGAIATGGVRILDGEVLRMFNVPLDVIEHVTAIERRELERRERQYRDDRPPPNVEGHTAILIDDGLATGSTMRAAVAALRKEGAKKIVVAVPVAPLETCEALSEEVDDIICAMTPEPFRAVGLWYADFSQTTDEEVRELLERAGREIHTPAHSSR
jgi:putative phosphoribosyl transferase